VYCNDHSCHSIILLSFNLINRIFFLYF